MSKFNAGDRVVSVSDETEDIRIGGVYTVVHYRGDVTGFLDDGGSLRIRPEDRYERLCVHTAPPDPALDYLKKRITQMHGWNLPNDAIVDAGIAELRGMLRTVYAIEPVIRAVVEFHPVKP